MNGQIDMNINNAAAVVHKLEYIHDGVEAERFFNG